MPGLNWSVQLIELVLSQSWSSMIAMMMMIHTEIVFIRFKYAQHYVTNSIVNWINLFSFLYGLIFRIKISVIKERLFQSYDTIGWSSTMEACSTRASGILQMENQRIVCWGAAFMILRWYQDHPHRILIGKLILFHWGFLWTTCTSHQQICKAQVLPSNPKNQSRSFLTSGDDHHSDSTSKLNQFWWFSNLSLH